jgi:choline dehydrogenase-like flavoprotein
MNDARMTWDIVIIGSGMGGSALAYGLRKSHARILMLERGDFIPAEKANWEPDEIVLRGRYGAKDTWYDLSGRPFQPRAYYAVGGNTKVYGAAMLRYRANDFEGVEHSDGCSERWPIRYADLAPYYDRAEALLGVHGAAGEDPLEPPRGPFPFPAVPHEPVIEELATNLRAQGLHPFHLPVAVDMQSGGACIRCGTCDGFPCRVHAKGDAESRFLSPVLASGAIDLWTNALVERLETTSDGKRVARAIVRVGGEVRTVHASLFVLAAGSVNSPALLLRSACDRFPNGLANSSGWVGRGYMAHNNTVIMALAPNRLNPTQFQKTLALNDFYAGGSSTGHPMGHIQMRGKILPAHLQRKEYIPRGSEEAIAARSVDFWLMSEDLPNPENRVWLDSSGRLCLHWKPNNQEPHKDLVSHTREILLAAGFSTFYEERRGVGTVSHQCGTTRFGSDPAKAVLDPFCRSFDLPNLFVVDTGFYPSSAAVNPALTLAAQALRVADHILEEQGLGGGRP